MSITIKSNPDGVSGAIQVNGNDVLTFGNGAQFSFRNKIINGAFAINQRAYVSGAATAAGQYTLDRWKVSGTVGITFSTVNNKTTVTIPAGQTLQQVIEGLNLATGTYVLSWEGTAQGRIGAGSYGASGTVTASITGGTNTTIEFNSGTVTNVQLEAGSIATPFEYRFYGLELSLCQRYYETSYPSGTAVGAASDGSGAIIFVAINNSDFYTFGSFRFSVKKRTAPTMTFYNPMTGTAGQFRGYSDSSNASTINSSYINDSGVGRVGCASSNMTGNSVYGFHYSASAEL